MKSQNSIVRKNRSVIESRRNPGQWRTAGGELTVTAGETCAGAASLSFMD